MKIVWFISPDLDFPFYFIVDAVDDIIILMSKKHIEVTKDGFITVYRHLEEPRHGCRLQALAAGVVKWLRRGMGRQ